MDKKIIYSHTRKPEETQMQCFHPKLTKFLLFQIIIINTEES
jgi:hypothetical protein